MEKIKHFSTSFFGGIIGIYVFSLLFWSPQDIVQKKYVYSFYSSKLDSTHVIQSNFPMTISKQEDVEKFTLYTDDEIITIF